MARKNNKTQTKRNSSKRFSYIILDVNKGVSRGQDYRSKGRNIRFSYFNGETKIKPCTLSLILTNSQSASLYRKASNLGITHVITKKGLVELIDYCRIINTETLVA